MPPLKAHFPIRPLAYSPDMNRLQGQPPRAHRLDDDAGGATIYLYAKTNTEAEEAVSIDEE